MMLVTPCQSTLSIASLETPVSSGSACGVLESIPHHTHCAMSKTLPRGGGGIRKRQKMDNTEMSCVEKDISDKSGSTSSAEPRSSPESMPNNSPSDVNRVEKEISDSIPRKLRPRKSIPVSCYLRDQSQGSSESSSNDQPGESSGSSYQQPSEAVNTIYFGYNNDFDAAGFFSDSTRKICNVTKLQLAEVTSEDNDTDIEMLLVRPYSDVRACIRSRVVDWRLAISDLEHDGMWWDQHGKMWFAAALKCLLGVQVDRFGETYRVSPTTDAGEHQPTRREVQVEDTVKKTSVLSTCIPDVVVIQLSSSMIKVVVEVKSAPSIGLKQLYQAMIGLWKVGNTPMIGIYCMNGLTTMNILRKEENQLTLQTSKTFDLMDPESTKEFCAYFIQTFEQVR